MHHTLDPIRSKIAEETGKTIHEVNSAWQNASKQAKYLIMGNPKKYNPDVYQLDSAARISLIGKLTRQLLGVDVDGVAPVVKFLP